MVVHLQTSFTVFVFLLAIGGRQATSGPTLFTKWRTERPTNAKRHSIQCWTCLKEKGTTVSSLGASAKQSTLNTFHVSTAFFFDTLSLEFFSFATQKYEY